MALVIANVDYVVGQLRTGHYELELDEYQLELFKEMTPEQQIEIIKDGDFLIDDCVVDEFGPISDVEIFE